MFCTPVDRICIGPETTPTTLDHTLEILMRPTTLLAALLLGFGISLTFALDSIDPSENVDSTNTDENVTYVTTENFKTEVLEANVPVLVDFTATWCAPCKELDPIIDSLLPEMSRRAKVFKLDIDESRDIFTQFGLTGVPTVLFFNNGVEEDRIVSPQSREVYVKYLEGMIQGTSALVVKIALLDEDPFRREFILTQRPDVLQETLAQHPSLLTDNFDNGQSPLSLILNSPASRLERRIEIVLSQEQRADIVLTQNPTINTGDLVGLGRCDEFRAIMRDDPAAVNRPDPDGNTPLLTALLHDGRLKENSCLRAVLDAGADPGIEDMSSYTLGRAAVMRLDLELLKELLKKGLNPERTDEEGRNALHWAAYYGYPGPVKVLLDHGLDPSVRALNGETAVDIVRQARAPWLAKKDTEGESEGLRSVLNIKNELIMFLEPNERINE